MKLFEYGIQSGLRRGIHWICAVALVWVPLGMALAQEPVGPPPPAAQNQPAPAAAPLTPDQLDDLVAPIALYPDGLLSQVLAASTYPLEIVEASQWQQQNRGLQGQALMNAARQTNWDPSVQALVAFPDVLTRLASDVNWTTDLGNAFLAQQGDVMNAVQQMRARAQADGRLSSNSQQTVTTQAQNGQTAIEIAPANPQVIYVPEYNPEYVWGPPVWGYYPPLYYPAVGFGFGFYPGIYLNAYFGGWGGWGFGGWGWSPNWFGGTIFTNGLFFNRFGFHGYYGNYYGGGRGIWAHNPSHRLGVPYSNAHVAQRFGGNFVGRGAAFHAGSGIGAQRAAGFAAGQRGAQSFSGARQGFSARGAAGGQFRGSQFSSGSRSSGAWQHFGGANGTPRGESFGGNRMATPQGRSFAPANRQGFSGGGASRSAPAFRAAPSTGGRSFGSSRPAGGGSGFSGGARSFSGGGARSFSGGGGRSFGGGGGGGFHGGGGARSSGGGGGHGGRR